MRKRVSVVVQLCFALVIACGISFAQSRDTVKVQIPYAVQVGNSTIPAGEYQIRELNTGSNSCVLLIQSEGVSMLVAATKVAAFGNEMTVKTELVLGRKDGGFMLERLEIAGRSYHYSF